MPTLFEAYQKLRDVIIEEVKTYFEIEEDSDSVAEARTIAECDNKEAFFVAMIPAGLDPTPWNGEIIPANFTVEIGRFIEASDKSANTRLRAEWYAKLVPFMNKLTSPESRLYGEDIEGEYVEYCVSVKEQMMPINEPARVGFVIMVTLVYDKEE